jgi:hypothetical protein
MGMEKITDIPEADEQGATECCTLDEQAMCCEDQDKVTCCPAGTEGCGCR